MVAGPDVVTLLSGALLGGVALAVGWSALRRGGSARPTPVVRFERRNNPWFDRRNAGVRDAHWPERRNRGRRHSDTFNPRR